MLRVSGALRLAGLVLLLGGLTGLLAAGGLYWYLAPKLPSIESLGDVRLQVPLRVYSRDRRLMAEFGEKRRSPLTLEDVPRRMIEAVLAAEDERFYTHPGVDWQGLTRAVIHLVRTGEKGPGGSTITMQVARNFFLGREKTYLRKLNEILLALKIERELTKNEILELYFNKIFLGNRAYGVGAAAQVYYGKPLEELALAEVAMIAGLPKAPSRFNPIVNPSRAVARRNYVLGRMRELDFITAPEYEAALAAEVVAKVHGLAVEIEAPYVAEMVRAAMEARAGSEAYTAGYKVYTTIDSRLQDAANRALRKALLEYDRRHGFRGPELQLDLTAAGDDPQAVLADIPSVGGLIPGLVTAVDGQVVFAVAKDFGPVEISWPGLEWARPHVTENIRGPKPTTAGDIVAAGDVIRLQLTEEGWRLAQVPAVEGALVSLDPHNGAISALAGGFDFYRSKFNRVIQAQRQPGSSFKPFIYSAALAKGYTVATLVNDSPVVFEDPGLEAAWRPENYSGKFFGPTRLREALVKSRNLISIRLLRSVGIDFALEHAQRFGLDTSRLPRNLSLALGSGSVTPLELARGYSVLANGGYLIEPFFMERVLESNGDTWLEFEPLTVCPECEQAAMQASAAEQDESTAVALETVAESQGEAGAAPERPGEAPPRAPQFAPRAVAADNIWLMASMMRDVVRRGTGRRAWRELGRRDLAGKTGTTNDQKDAWFSGFTPNLVATAWVGFDQLSPLGRRETGARAALPMWIEFMRTALEGVEEEIPEQPAGLVTVRIDPQTGRSVGANFPDAVFETFRARYAPESQQESPAATLVEGTSNPSGLTEQLF